MNIADIASLPTDNLYKFMAMSGLIIAVASVALAAHHYKQLLRRFFEVKRRVVVHKAKVKMTEVDIDLANKITSELKQRVFDSMESIKRAQSAGLTETAVPDYQSELASLQHMMSTNTSVIAQHGIELAELDADTGELTFLATQLKTLTRVAIVGLAIGTALVGSGFYLWYTKVQVLLDHALAIQSAVPK